MSRHTLQRCKDYVPGLRSMPWWSPDEVPQAGVLEAHGDAIAREFEDLVLAGRLRLHPQSHPNSTKQLTAGDWGIFELYYKGLPHVGNLLEAPVTAQVLEALGDSIDNPQANAFFSVLQPGMHIWPHCGPTNTRICLHLGLKIPAGATIRVGTETRSWEEGKCLVFDDSWEHEATNPSDHPRTVLLVDVWHPDLSAEQRKSLDTRHAGTPAAAGDRGWIRHGGDSPTDVPVSDPIDPAIFAMLGVERTAHIITLARKAFRLDLPAIAEASRRALRVLAPERDDESVIEPVPSPVVDHVLWTELAMLANRAPEYGLQSSDVVDLATVCSICWRTWPGRENAMMDFLEAWPAADKAACADKLVALRSVSRMVGALGDLEVLGDPPPFGALVPLLCAAYRRASDGASRHA